MGALMMASMAKLPPPSSEGPFSVLTESFAIHCLQHCISVGCLSCWLEVELALQAVLDDSSDDDLHTQADVLAQLSLH